MKLMMKTSNFRIWTFALAFAFNAAMNAQSFAPGNLAVLRLGDGTQTLLNSGNTVFLDQYSTNGVLVNSNALPDSGTNALLVSGTASSEGGLSRTLDRTAMVIAGYNTNRGSVTGSLANTTGTAVPRGVVTVNATGAYVLAQTSTAVYSANNIRGGAGDGSNNFWTAGANTGTFYLNPPNPPVTIQSTIANTRYIKAIAGNLYFSTQAGTPGIYTFQGGGLPKAGATTSLLFGTGASSQAAGFDINPSLTVAYVADQRNTAGGIQKWTNNAGAWGLAYTFATGAGAFAVAADFSGAAPMVYATTGESVSNRLVCINDTNASATVNFLATAGSNRWFRGIDFAPVAAPSAPSLAIQLSGTNVVVSWPEAATGYTLQNIMSLGPNDWSGMTNVPVTANGSNTVSVPASGAQQFFRLKQ